MPFRLIVFDKTDRNQTISQNGDGEEDGDADEDLELPLFKLSSITAATDTFALYNKLGEGGFGPVYRVSFSH